MSHADLSGVLVRIDRAKTHLNDFDIQASPIIRACQDGITRERDEQRSEYIFRLGPVPIIQPVMSAILGDAIHNLRVALDYLAWQLVLATGKEPPNENTSFPILITSPTPNRYGRVRLNISPGISKDAGRILDEVQPYKRTKPAHHDLAVLDKLDIRDKHHELLVAIIGVKSPSIGWFGDFELTAFNAGPYQDGSHVCRFAYSDANSEIEFNPHISFAIRLDEPAAGPWRHMLGAADLVRRPLRYIEDEVLPRFRCFF